MSAVRPEPLQVNDNVMITESPLTLTNRGLEDSLREDTPPMVEERGVETTQVPTVKPESPKKKRPSIRPRGQNFKRDRTEENKEGGKGSRTPEVSIVEVSKKNGTKTKRPAKGVAKGVGGEEPREIAEGSDEEEVYEVEYIAAMRECEAREEESGDEGKGRQGIPEVLMVEKIQFPYKTIGHIFLAMSFHFVLLWISISIYRIYRYNRMDTPKDHGYFMNPNTPVHNVIVLEQPIEEAMYGKKRKRPT